MTILCRFKHSLAFVMIFITISASVFADSLSYSGRLVNTNGSPVSGKVDLKFELAYSGTPASIKCTDDIAQVQLTNGVFHVKLDFACVPATPTLNETLSAVPGGEEVMIRVTNETASKVYSFQSLSSIPFAQVAHGLSKLNANNNEVLTWTGSKWEPKAVTGATGGTVTSIVAGSGLSGGTITNSGTIGIAAGGVADSHLAGNIARAKLVSGTANYVLVNDASGGLSEVAQLPVTHGGTGANTIAGARTNLGLGTAATADIGMAPGNAMTSTSVPSCFSFEKLQMTAGPTYTWSCVADNDSADATKLPLTGGTMSGAIAMGNNKITGLATPTVATDAATMAYVDSKVGTASQWVTSGSDIYYNTGNVGVGTATPGSKLDVAGKIKTSGSNAYLEMHDTDTLYTANPQAGLVFRDSGNSQYSFIGPISGNMQFFSWIPIELNVNNNIGVHVATNGNVGIGGTTTSEKLYVSGNAAVSGNLRLKSDNANFVDLKAPAALAGNLIYTFPGTNGTSGQALITDGSGNLTWATVATGASAVGGDLTGTVSNAQIASGVVGSTEITDASIVDADIAAGAAIDQSKINGLVTSLSGKESTITAGTTAQYWRGDKSWQTLNTAAVAESTNLYFTEPRVLGTDLAGYSATTGAISAADTVLSAIEKLSGNLAATSTAQANYVLKAGDTMSGPLAMGNNKITGLATPTVGTDAATMAYVDSKVSAAPGDNLGNHTATTNLAMGSNNITGVNKIYLADGAWNSPTYSFSNSTNTGLYYGGSNIGFSVNGGLALNLSPAVLQLNGTYAGYIRGTGANDATAPTYAFGGDINTGMFSLSTDILGFTTNGVEKMRILATGEMALGKTTAAGKLDVAGDIATDGKLRLKSDNANYVELRAPASLAATTTYTFPATAGTSGYALTTNGAGVLSWSAVATTASAVGGDLNGTIANAQINSGAVGSTEIADASIVDADIANSTITYGKLNLTDGDIPQAKVNGLVSALSGKEPTITAGTTAQYWRGDKSWQTLITTAVPEGTNLYFTQPRVLASIMSGYTTGTAIPINATDTVSQAFGKLEAQIIANSTAENNKWDKNGTSVYYNDGNVGIGTNAPSTALTVVGTTTTTTLAAGTAFANQLAVDGTVPAYTNANIRNRATDGVSGILFTDAAGTGKGFVGHINSAAAAPYPVSTLSLMGAGVPVTLGVSGYEVIRISDSTGYVGVGTNNPQARIEIDGSMRLSRATDNSTSRFISFQTATDTNNSANGFANGDSQFVLDGGANSGTNTLHFIGSQSRTLNLSLFDGSLFVGGKVGVATTTPATLMSNINAADSFVNVGDSFATGQNAQSFSWKSNAAGYSAAIINTSTANGANGLQVRTAAATANQNVFTVGTGVLTAANADILNVKGDGKVGIGTNSPTGNLQVQTTTDATINVYSGDTYQAGVNVGAGTNNRWLIYRNSAATGRYMAIWRDLSAVGGPASGNVMTFLGNGNIGISNDAPAARLDVNGYSSSGGVGTMIIRNAYNSAGTRFWQVGPDGNGNGNFVVYNEGLTGAYIVHGQTAWSSSSDKRLKKDIKLIPDGLEKVLKLNGVTYQYKKDKKLDPRKAGVIAQDVKKVLPEAVTESDGYLSVKYTELIPLLIEGTKDLYKTMTAQFANQKREIASIKDEADTRIKKLESDNERKDREIIALKKKNDDMNIRLERLEKSMNTNAK